MHAVRLYDTPIGALPDDLYIPPDAFAIWLEQFEGPLDFLLYLVKKNNFDISTTALLPITEQYLTYIKELKEDHFELAGDYLLMASTLIAIKSELLLPASTPISDEKSPKARLIRRLEEYAQIKTVSFKLDALIRLERDVFMAMASMPDADIMAKEIPPYPATMLIDSLIKMQIKPISHHHDIKADSVSLSERMTSISRLLAQKGQSSFMALIDKSQGKLGVVVSFIAVLELSKQRLITLKNTDSNNNDLLDTQLVWIN